MYVQYKDLQYTVVIQVQTTNSEICKQCLIKTEPTLLLLLPLFSILIFVEPGKCSPVTPDQTSYPKSKTRNYGPGFLACFLQTGCPSSHSNNKIKTLKAK